MPRLFQDETATEVALWTLVGFLHEVDDALHATLDRLLEMLEDRRSARS
jgi:hypothetical protein